MGYKTGTSILQDRRILFSVKEASLANERLRQVINQQKSVMSDQSLRITQLQQDLTATRRSLSQLHATCERRYVENDQIISSLRLELYAVSIVY